MGAFNSIQKLSFMPETGGQLTDMDLSENKDLRLSKFPCEIFYGVGDGVNTTYQIQTGFDHVLGGYVQSVASATASATATVRPTSNVGEANVVVPANNATYLIVIFGNKRPII